MRHAHADSAAVEYGPQTPDEVPGYVDLDEDLRADAALAAQRARFATMPFEELVQWDDAVDMFESLSPDLQAAVLAEARENVAVKIWSISR